jgi:surfactin synthase thioesterase subunit
MEIAAVQYPGHEGRYRESFATSVADLAGPLAAAIHAIPESPDVILYGHSLGAFVAFAVAREMRRRGFALPKHLVLSGSRAPDEISIAEPIHAAADEVVIGHVRGLGSVPEEVLSHPQMMQFFLPILRSGLRLDETHQHQFEPPLPCGMSVFAGEQDPEMTIDQARAWARHTTGPFELRVLPAGHWWPEACEREILHSISCLLTYAGS